MYSLYGRGSPPGALCMCIHRCMHELMCMYRLYGRESSPGASSCHDQPTIRCSNHTATQPHSHTATQPHTQRDTHRYTQIHTHEHTHTCTRTRTHARMHARTHTHTYAHTHTHIHTRTGASQLPRSTTTHPSTCLTHTCLHIHICVPGASHCQGRRRRIPQPASHTHAYTYIYTCQVRHIAKVDDDTFLNLPLLQRDLNSFHCAKHLYYGVFAFAGCSPQRFRKCMHAHMHRCMHEL